MRFFDKIDSFLGESPVSSSDSILFYWDEKTKNIENSVNLKDLFNFYRVNTVHDLGKFIEAPSKLLEEYLFLSRRIRKILLSYRNFPAGRGQHKFELVPKSMLEDFKCVKIEVLKRSVDWISDKFFYAKAVNFFSSKFKGSVIDDICNDINTIEGYKKIDLVYQANFRFKNHGNGFNFFILPKKERKMIVPERGSFLFSADFRQFEFRTFLDIRKEIECNFENEDLYDQIAKKFSLNKETAKRNIIAYLYGSRNDTLDKFLNKNKILDMLQEGEFVEFDGFPVYFKKDELDHIKIHTVVQAISQFRMIEKLHKLIKLTENSGVKFLFPLHDEVLLSIREENIDSVKTIIRILEDDKYKLKKKFGYDFLNMKEF